MAPLNSSSTSPLSSTTGTNYSSWGTGTMGTIPIKREKHEIKCSICGKALAEVYSYGEVDSVYCDLCHKIEKLKE